MVQSVNVAGLRSVWTLLVRPSLLLPDLAVRDIRSLSFSDLHNKHNIRYLVFDKDNCLTAPYVDSIYPPYRRAWADCISEFSAQNILIVSNSAGTPDDSQYAAACKVEQELGVPVLRHHEKKPRCINEILAQFGNPPPHTVAVIGDRLATDVAMANMGGMVSIWVQNIVTSKGDNPVAAALRSAEHLVYRLIKNSVQPPK
ncbi:hypothetical protein IWW36_000427 [Coemansia brasiliensis]|uniref:HAD-superfamily phosphatase n=1 Tax=Coemansia brasiliensis TaxID=2650707 RepID=A0A9W8IIR9_9FUNG|nr:hypothetical protein IWW36_000427 [Coemansia brasiliensis]